MTNIIVIINPYGWGLIIAIAHTELRSLLYWINLPSVLLLDLRLHIFYAIQPYRSDEGKSCAAPAPSSEKWSHEAIVARSNVRPERMQKLKLAENSGQNPGFDFLLSCWNNPALVIVIKKLLAKFPQWNIVCVDGVRSAEACRFPSH
ncbi:MAG: hypothetical protein V7K28_22605, partial [Nostoc sp.]